MKILLASDFNYMHPFPMIPDLALEHGARSAVVNDREVAVQGIGALHQSRKSAAKLCAVAPGYDDRKHSLSNLSAIIHHKPLAPKRNFGRVLISLNQQ